MKSIDPLRNTDVQVSRDATLSDQEIPSSARLSRGATIGRYVIVDALGAGGMGVVYSAYDAVLDRKIALKLLRPRRSPDDSASSSAERLKDAHSRLMREAQSMARLSHPNVITVHDVGMFEDQVYIAMEFAEGGTLRKWLDVKQRPLREVIDVFVYAGRGLQAAHSVGIVHRDFKPDNVLLGKDGRVYVADFGLARQLIEPTHEAAPPPAIDASAVPLSSTSLTQTGAILGTPAYMSPEQGQGRPTDARTDQFSYCVALYEAVYGQHPFRGEDVLAMLFQAQQGLIRQPPEGSKVPWRIQRVLWRGLSPDPDDRYPSMDALLSELRRTPRQVTLSLLFIVVAVALVGWGGSVYLGLKPAKKRICQVLEQDLKKTWNESHKKSLRAAFAATGKPYAESTVNEVERVLADYTQGWADTHKEICEAARVRREKTKEVLDTRMECLRQRLQETRSLVQLFASADAGVVEKAVPAVHALTSVADCAEHDALFAPPPPVDAEQRRRVDELRVRLAEVKVRSDASQFEASLPIASDVVLKAQQIGYRPLAAEALLQLGELQGRAGKPVEAEQTLYEAVFTAEAGRHPVVAANASAQLVLVLGVQRNLFPLAHHFARDAAARIEGLGGHRELAAVLAHHHAVVYNAQGRYAEALPLVQRAVDMRRRLFGGQHFTLIAPLRTAGQVLLNLGRHDDALARLQEALDIGKKTLGPSHTLVASTLHTIAGVNLLLSRFAEAQQHFAQALAINEAALGPTHPDVGLVRFGLSSCALRQGRYEEGLRHAEQAMTILRGALGPQSVQSASAVMNAGYALLRLGRFQESLAQAQQALAIFENQRVNNQLLHRGYALIVLGESHLGLGDLRQALTPLEDAVALFEASQADRDALALARFALARVLWQQPASRRRAVSLAEQARSGVSVHLDPQLRAQLESWMAQHPAGRLN